MNEIPTIAERLVTYYNNLIKNNVIAGEAPVTLEWLRRQRIVEGRSELDIRFGYITVDKVLGEKTPLAKAEQYLYEAHHRDKYELLPEIAQLLSEECTSMLTPDNPVRIKYASLKTEITFPTVEILDEEINLKNVFRPNSNKKISISQLEELISFIPTVHCNHNIIYFRIYFYTYLRECVYFALANAFKEIKETVIATTK